MARSRGVTLMPGDSWSQRFPGFIENIDGLYRKPRKWVNKKGKLRSVNSYYRLVSCDQCGVRILRDKSNVSHNTVHSCGKLCLSKIRSTPDGHRIYKRGGKSGHVMVKSSTHPRRNKVGMVPEHRLVVEKHIGRHLRKDEIVHHINCVKDDNRLMNLVICRGDSEHFLIHGSLNKCVAALMESGAILFSREANRYYVGVGW